MVKEFLQTAICNSVALFALPFILSGFSVDSNLLSVVIAGGILTLVNFFIKPIIKVISFPINFVTLGFFSLFINAILLYITFYFTSAIKVDGGYFKFDVLDLGLSSYYLGWVWTLILASFIISFINWLLKKLVF